MRHTFSHTIVTSPKKTKRFNWQVDICLITIKTTLWVLSLEDALGIIDYYKRFQTLLYMRVTNKGTLITHYSYKHKLLELQAQKKESSTQMGKLNQYVSDHKAEMSPPFADKELFVSEDIIFTVKSVTETTGQFGRQWFVSIETLAPCNCYMEDVIVEKKGKLPTKQKVRGTLEVEDFTLSFAASRAKDLVIGKFLASEVKANGGYGPCHLVMHGKSIDIEDYGTDEHDDTPL